MLSILYGIGAMGAVAAIVVVSTIFGGMFGALIGKILEHTFIADFIVSGLAVFGVSVLPHQFPGIGAAMGFVGSFFKTTITGKEK